MSCSYILPEENDDMFIGCDRKPWTNEFLLFHLKTAIIEENYEWANECKQELIRRGVEIIF